MSYRGNAALLGALFCLAGCDKSATTSDNAATAGNAPATTTASAAPTPPAHNWSYREGQEYGYPGVVSEDAQKAGQAVARVQMLRFLGAQNGVYTVAQVSDGMMMTASCANPCEVVKIYSGGAMQRVTFNPESIVGAALTDAFNGQMEIYGAGAPAPAPQPSAPPPVPATPAAAAAPSADPYAADKTAEREADASTGQGPNGAATSNGGTAATSGGVTRYACAFAPDLSANPLPGVGGLSTVVDEPRSCINGRTAYARTKGGGLARVMLSDRDRRLSVMSFSPDRRTFTRQDFILDANRYTSARRDGGDLIAIGCPATGGAGDVSSVQTRLATAHSVMRTALGGVTPSRRMTWHCVVI